MGYDSSSSMPIISIKSNGGNGDHQLSEELQKKFDPLLGGLTPYELHCLASYCCECADNAKKEFEDNVTIDDFEKIKKNNDYEEASDESDGEEY